MQGAALTDATGSEAAGVVLQQPALVQEQLQRCWGAASLLRQLCMLC